MRLTYAQLIIKQDFMGPNLVTHLTILMCGWGTGPFLTGKRHGTHQYFFCSGEWGILFTRKAHLQTKIHPLYKDQCP